MESELLKQTSETSVDSFIFSAYKWEFWAFENLKTKTKDIGDHQLIWWFCIFDCTIFCDGFYCRWKIYCPSNSKGGMFQEQCNSVEYGRKL